jgi:hypothetical protein
MATEDDEVEMGFLDPLFGMKRMVDDPRIPPAQAAVVLGVSVAQVYRLMKLGRLPRHGAPNTSWELLLSDVEQLRDRGRTITLKQAARLLHSSTEDVREQIDDGKLTGIPDSRRPVYLREARALARATNVPKTRNQQRQRTSPPAGHVNTKEAASVLGRSPSRVRQLAAQGGFLRSRTRAETTGTSPSNLRWFGALGWRPMPTPAARWMYTRRIVTNKPKHHLEGGTHVFEARHGVPPRQPNRALELHGFMGAIVRTADQSGRPFSRRLTARWASRLASRSASAFRLSQVFLPRARAISTFARPSLK